LPDEGTLLREWSDPKVYRIMGGVRRWVTTPTELGKYGGFPSVRLVPDGALAAIPQGAVLPAPNPAECATLRTRLTQIEAQIADLRDQLEAIEDPRREGVLRNRLQNAMRERDTVRSRINLLRCP
jgi:hypothetical protein